MNDEKTNIKKPQSLRIMTITNSDILKACTTIIGFGFASIGFLLNAKNIDSISNQEFSSILQSMLLVIVLFSFPVIIFLLLDILPNFLLEVLELDNLEYSFKIVKLFFLLSFFSIPIVFFKILISFDINLSGFEVDLVIILITFFLTLLAYSLLHKVLQKLIFYFTSKYPELKGSKDFIVNKLFPVLISIVLVLLIFIVGTPIILEQFELIDITDWSNLIIITSFLSMILAILFSPSKRRGTGILLYKMKRDHFRLYIISVSVLILMLFLMLYQILISF